MEIVIFLAVFMILLGSIFLGAFLFSIRKGQFDDLETPAHKILLDDEKIESKKTLNADK